MKKYCRYCSHCGYRSENEKDVYRCVKLGLSLKTSAVVRATTCKSFDYCGYDAKSGLKHVPKEERGTPPEGQLFF
mgnify:CR=1 FL=1